MRRSRRPMRSPASGPAWAASRLGAAAGSVALLMFRFPAYRHPATRSSHMRSSRRGRSIAAMLLAALLLVVAGCGSDDSSSTESTSSAGGGGESAKTLKVGLVTDIGGLNDRGFNQLANQGLEDAKSQLQGIEGRVITSDQTSDYIPNLSTFGQQRYDLVIGVGFLMAEALEQVANRFPDTKFAIIDASAEGMKSKPKNVEGLLF